MLEPVANSLQAVSMDMHKVKAHIHELLKIMEMHRSDSTHFFKGIMESVADVATKLDLEITIPRLSSRQSHRPNYPSATPEEFYRVAVYLPYLDSVISSLKHRFPDQNNVAYSLLELHPTNMKNIARSSFTKHIREVEQFYGIENLSAEAECWYELWSTRVCDKTFLDLLEDCKDFFPAVAQAIEICLVLPATTCSVERSFSTLRRVKTWLRSTICSERLNGLCMLSLHRERIVSKKDIFIEAVITRFGQRSLRRLQFVFQE